MPYASWTVSFLLLAGTDEVALVAAAATLFGVGIGMSLPTLTVLVGDAAPPHLRGALTALSGTALFLGQFGSPLLLGSLADQTSLPSAFLGAAGLSGAILMGLFHGSVAGSVRHRRSLARGPASGPGPSVNKAGRKGQVSERSVRVD